MFLLSGNVFYGFDKIVRCVGGDEELSASTTFYEDERFAVGDVGFEPADAKAVKQAISPAEAPYPADPQTDSDLFLVDSLNVRYFINGNNDISPGAIYNKLPADNSIGNRSKKGRD